MAATKQRISSGGITVQFLTDEEDSGGASTGFIARLQPGCQAPPAHSHDRFDETVYGVAGVTTFTIEGVKHELRAGEGLVVRRGVPHKFENLGDEEAVMFTVATPGVFLEDYFIRLAGILNDAAAAGGPPDVEAMLAVFGDYGVTPAPAG